MLVLHPPVEAPIVRPFAYAGSPFQRGLHRGVDFGAPPGVPVRAPCDGTVAYAGPRAVTLLCGGERVTLLPLRDVRARAGRSVDAGEPLAAVGSDRGHRGVHLGVRHAGDPFGYVDPEPLLRGADPPLGPAPPPARRGPRSGRPAASRPVPAVRGAPEPAAGAAIAPWPAWLGAAVAALAAAGSARVRLRRRARVRAHRAVSPVAPE